MAVTLFQPAIPEVQRHIRKGMNTHNLTIQQFAQICRTTPRTLRFYEEKGLFKPIMVDEWNKYRFYDPKQAREFLKIKLLQNFHIPLKQINKSLKKNAAEEYLKKRLNELQEEIREKEKEYEFLEKIKNFLFEDKNLEDIFQTQTFGPYNLFCMKVEHGEYAKITEYIKALWQEAKRLKLNCENSEITFYLNNAYNPKNTPLEIALICKPSLSHLTSGSMKTKHHGLNEILKENFYFKMYPKTKALAFKYNGPYEYLILIYQKLFSYIENHRANLKGLVFEKYIYGPLNTKSKYDYQTTIGFPV